MMRVGSPRRVRVMAYDYHTGELTPGRTWAEYNGVTTAVDWFGIEDLILWPKLIVDLGRLGVRAVPALVRAGSRAVVVGAEIVGGVLAKRVATQEFNALMKLERALAGLADMEVKLGGLAGHDFAKITGDEAVKQLFSRRLSQLPRLAQHWPEDLAKRYVDELRDLISKRVTRLKDAKPILAELKYGTLSKQTMKKLPDKLQTDVKRLIEERWKTIRTAFWRNVYDDRQLVGELNRIGLRFAKRGNVPVMEIGGHKLTITLDHVARKVENPFEAFLKENLVAATSMENSAQKEQLAALINHVYEMSVDEFAAHGLQPLPKDIAAGLGEALDKLAVADDVFAGLGWETPAATIPKAQVLTRRTR